VPVLPATIDPSEPKNRGALAELARDPASRGRFLKLLGGGAGAATAFGLFLAACGGEDDDGGATTSGQTTDQAMSADLEIVNYALTLEYLEADFYAKVIESGLFTGAQLNLIKIIGDHEAQHVEALEGTASQLGTPADKLETMFDLQNANQVLTTAAEVENLGAAAYLGQAGRIQDKEILAAAISIHSVEARHASALNSLLGKSATPDGAFSKPASMDEVLPKVQPFLVKS
jgi:hypothetical protein